MKYRSFYFLSVFYFFINSFSINPLSGQCNPNLYFDLAVNCFEAANSAINMSGNGLACDLDSFCINTQSVPQADPPIPFCSANSVLNNPIWFSFLSDSSAILDIDITSWGCTGGSQWALYDQCGNYFNSIACQAFPIIPPDMPFNISTIVEPGTFYYLVIDGENGAFCNYGFKVNSGVAPIQVQEAVDTLLSGNTNVCPNEISSFSFEGFPYARNYTWSIDGIVIKTTSTPELNYSFPGIEVGTHQLCVTGTNYCDTNGQSLCWDLMVKNDQTIITNRNVCTGDSILFQNNYYTSGTYTINYVGSNPCIEFVELHVNDYILPFDTTYNAVICNDLEAFEYSGEFYKLDSLYENVPFHTIEGCTFEAKFLVTHLDTSGYYISATLEELPCNSPLSSVLTFNGLPLPNATSYGVKWYNKFGQWIGAGKTLEVEQPGDYYAIFTQFYVYPFDNVQTHICETRLNYTINNTTEIITDPILTPGLQTPAAGEYEVKISNPENYPAGTEFVWIIPAGLLNTELTDGISLYLPIKGTYSICVYAQDDCSRSDTSCIDVIVTETLGSNAQLGNHFFRLLQNPVDDYLIMDLKNRRKEQFNIRVFDINGSVVRDEIAQTEGSIFKLGVHDLYPGIYIYQILDESRMLKTGKFVKI